MSAQPCPIALPLRRPDAPRLPPHSRRLAGGLPGFLRRALDETRLERSIETGQLWCETDGPVTIRDFDAREDVLSLAFEAPDALPDLAFERDEDTGVTHLYANGKPIAILEGRTLGFDLGNVALCLSAA